MKLCDQELKEIYGGAFKEAGFMFIITSVIAFFSGVLEGYTNSNKCNNI